MAVCDLAIPILKPLKPQSQLGFTSGLFVKLANIAVTEKRALAIFHNLVVLHQFLDAESAFDETLHPIILNQMFNGNIENDIWKYFELLHQNSTTHLKWNGMVSVDAISEGKGNRQGGLASGDEWKLYNNEMIHQLEEAATPSDRVSGISTSCVAVADDVAPCVTADDPREALHKMQNLLSVVEDNGNQLHMKFGKKKCKLLISGRPNMIRKFQFLSYHQPSYLYGTDTMNLNVTDLERL